MLATVGLGIHRCTSCGGVDMIFLVGKVSCESVDETHHVSCHHEEHADIAADGLSDASHDCCSTEIFVVQVCASRVNDDAEDGLPADPTLFLNPMSDLRADTFCQNIHSALPEPDGLPVRNGLFPEISQWRL